MCTTEPRPEQSDRGFCLRSHRLSATQGRRIPPDQVSGGILPYTQIGLRLGPNFGGEHGRR